MDGVAQEVAAALSAIRSTQELVRFYETEALPQARRSVETARATYQAGEQSVLALIEAQETLIAQQQAQVNALRDLAQARAELERAVGGPIPDGRELNPVSRPRGDESKEDEP